MTELCMTAPEARRRFEAMRAAYDAYQHEPSSDGGSKAPGDGSFRVPPVPYPGLRSFTPQEGAVFFGRERNVDEIRQRLAHLNFAVLLGGSGSGKSSLVRAGLIPRLNSTKGIPGRSGNWYAAEFRPRLRPLEELITALANLVIRHFPDQGPGEAGDLGQPDLLALSRRLREEFSISSEVKDSHKDRSARAEALCASLFKFVEVELDQRDRIATNGLRSGRPSLFLVVDQFEEIFRPEVTSYPNSGGPELLDLLIAAYAKLERDSRLSIERRNGLFVVITMRSEELHRCTEHPVLRLDVGGEVVHRSLADLVNGSMYLLDLLDPREDRSELRDAIIGPARRVFVDWGMPLDSNNVDAPFAPGVADWLLEGAGRLSVELKHRPDQLPLLQHGLQSIWRGAMDGWRQKDQSLPFEIRKEHLQYECSDESAPLYPDLVACLDLSANATAFEGVQHFTQASGMEANLISSNDLARDVGRELICSSFRALAQRDDRGNWARRFADSRLVMQFLPRKTSAQRLSLEQRLLGIRAVLSSFVSRGYLVVKDEYYDISHEALIRNWKQYQEWLRDPEEVSGALVRAVMDLDPRRIQQSLEGEEELLGCLPPLVCETLAKLFKRRELPEAWAVEQVLPLVNRPGVSNRWGSTNPTEIVSRLGDLVDRAESVRVKRANQRRRRILSIGGLAIALLAFFGAFFWWQSIKSRQAALINRTKSIALHAEDTLENEGPAQSILIALQASKANLPNIPEVERVIYKSLRQLREKRIIRANAISRAAIRPAGDVIAGLSPKQVTFWRATDGKVLDDYPLPMPTPTQAWNIRWSPDGEQFAVSSGNQIVLITPCSRPAIRVLFSSCKREEEKDRLRSFGTVEVPAGLGKFSRNGEFIITASRGTEARIWKVATGERKDLGVNAFSPWAIALAPDMRYAAVGTDQGEIKIINLETMQTRAVQVPGDSNVSSIISLDFGRTSDVLIVTSQYGRLWLLGVPDQKWVPLKAQQGGTFQTAVSDDGKSIATAGTDGAVRLWRLNQISDGPDLLRGHKGPVHSVQFDRAGSTVISASFDNTIRLWSPSSALSPYVEQPTTVSRNRGLDPPNVWESLHEALVAHSEDGFTVKAYNLDSEKLIALFGPTSAEEPFFVWGREGQLQWHAVAIRAGESADKGVVHATLANEDTYSLVFFKKPEALTRFAEEQLPFEGERRIQLNDKELCKLGLGGPQKSCAIGTE